MSGEPCKCGAEDCRSCNPLYAQQEEGLRGYHKPDKRPDLPACPFCGATAESGDYIHIDRLGEQWRAFVECRNGKCPVQPCCLADSMAEAERGWGVRDTASSSLQSKSLLVSTERAIVELSVRRFNRDDKASIAHALMHLETNKIADDDYPGHSGWYCGNREQFVKRHKKAVALMRSLLAPTPRLMLRRRRSR